MRPISSLLAVAVCTTGLIVACGGGLGSPTDSLLGNDPIPNSSDHPGSSTDPPGSSTDPTGNENCVCPVGEWQCGEQISVDIALKDGACMAGKTAIDPCTGAFSSDGLTGTIKAKGNGVELCVGSKCLACTPGTVTTSDASVPDTSVQDTGVQDTSVKDTSVPDVGKDVTAQVCTSFCTANSDCASTCPAAGSGNSNCCDSANTGTCFVEPSSVCSVGP